MTAPSPSQPPPSETPGSPVGASPRPWLHRNRVVRLAVWTALWAGLIWGRGQLHDWLEDKGGFQARSISPDGRWLVVARGEGAFLFSSETVRLSASPLGQTGSDLWPSEFQVSRLEIYNDGASLGDWNLLLAWRGPDQLEATTHGQEQADTTYRFDLGESRNQARWDLLGNWGFAVLGWLGLWAMAEIALAQILRSPARETAGPT